MSRIILSLWLLLVPSLILSGPEIDEKLTEMLSEAIDGFPGDVGIYVEHLSRDLKVEIDADTLFPTASMIKVPIMIQIFELIEKGELDYREELAWYADSINYPYGGGILSSFEDGKEIALDKIVSLMMTYSDNHASLWCQKLASGERINKWLVKNGYEGTRMNSRTEGRQGDWKKYGWGQTTPREMARLVKSIRQRAIISDWACDEMYRVMARPYWNQEALSQIPPYVQAASKNGAVSASRSEVVLVNAPSGDYLFCVITKNQKDKSWEQNNDGFVLIRTVSRILWQYFEPDSEWAAGKK